MAVLAFTNGMVTLNSTDLSSYCKKIELDVEAEALDTTAFSSGGYKSAIGGLKSGKLSLTFNQDFANTLLDSIMWPLLGTVVTFDVRGVNAAASTSNPRYTGSVLIEQWNPLSTGVGELVEVDVSFSTTGTVTRQTS